MKTYYGQMTADELRGTYLIPNSVEEMHEFIDMCLNAGYTSYVDCSEVRILGIGYPNKTFSNRVEWVSIEDSNFYLDEGMTQIKWYPKQDSTSDEELYVQIKSTGMEIALAEEEVRKWSDRLETSKAALNTLVADLEQLIKKRTGLLCFVRRPN